MQDCKKHMETIEFNFFISKFGSNSILQQKNNFSNSIKKMKLAENGGICWLKINSRKFSGNYKGLKVLE